MSDSENETLELLEIGNITNRPTPLASTSACSRLSDSEGETGEKPELLEIGNIENQPPPTSSNNGNGNNINYNNGFSTRRERSVPKHMRLRYWNSWEEMRLIELWRRHSTEVTTLSKNTPVFRTIMEGMRGCGFSVNSQECRRKINTLKNKYITERRRIESGELKNGSEWRLYPLIHCLLAPKQKKPDLTHQLKIMQQLRSRFAHLQPAPAEPSIPNSNNPPSSTPPPQAAQPRHQPYRRRRSTAVSYLVRQNFTLGRLQQLRYDNKLLSEERDNACRQLENEEKEYKKLEEFLILWRHQQEVLLQRLQCSNGGNGNLSVQE